MMDRLLRRPGIFDLGAGTYTTFLLRNIKIISSKSMPYKFFQNYTAFGGSLLYPPPVEYLVLGHPFNHASQNGVVSLSAEATDRCIVQHRLEYETQNHAGDEGTG